MQFCMTAYCSAANGSESFRYQGDSHPALKSNVRYYCCVSLLTYADAPALIPYTHVPSTTIFLGSFADTRLGP